MKKLFLHFPLQINTMIRKKSEEEIKIMRKGGRILASLLQTLGKEVKPEVALNSINDLTNALCKKFDVVPIFLNYQPDWAQKPFPGSVCISIDDEVVHGIPNNSSRKFKEGDIVALDMGISFKGLIVDSAITVLAGKGDQKAKKLISTTKQALQVGIDAARSGKRTGDIGFAIEQFVKKNGYGIPHELSGHGVGHKVHEDPVIPNFGKPGQGPKLEPGMTIAIEPQLTEGKGKLYLARDGYTLKTADHSRSAHFEHTIAITNGQPVVLTEL